MARRLAWVGNDALLWAEFTDPIGRLTVREQGSGPGRGALKCALPDKRAPEGRAGGTASAARTRIRLRKQRLQASCAGCLCAWQAHANVGHADLL